jgi:hypothetical protein
MNLKQYNIVGLFRGEPLVKQRERRERERERTQTGV